MAPIIELQLFIVVAMMSHLDAHVRIHQNRVYAGHDFTECGEKLVLTCFIDNYFPNSTMTWQNENSSLTIVSCAGGTCALNPAVGSKYSKSENTTTGTFNLTIPTVTRDNNGISYLCENGLFTNSSIVKVRDYRPPILNETGETTLKVRSGCINRNDVHLLKFMWKIQKPGTTDEKGYDDVTYIDTNGTVDTDFCTHDTECGLNGFVTLERTIEVEPGDANDYHLIAVIYYGDVKRHSSQTNKTYKIGDMQKSPSIPQTITKTTFLTSEYTSNTTVHTLVNTTLNTGICVFGIGDVLVIVIFIILFIVHFILAIQNLHRIYKDLESSRKEAIISTLPAIIFLCMSIIVCCVCKYTGKPCIFCAHIGIFGIICACLLCVSYCIGITLSIWAYYKDKSENKYYNSFFFCTFLNLIVLPWFADFYRKNKGGMLAMCRKKHKSISDEGKICCFNCKAQENAHASHAYCLSHEVYMCTKCLNKSHKRCVLLWNTGDKANKDHKLCCNEHYKLEDLMLEGVCQDCNKFICSKCMKNHKEHVCTRHQQLHEQWSIYNNMQRYNAGLISQTQLCSGCHKHPIECLNVNTKIELCADCFESGKQPVPVKFAVEIAPKENNILQGEHELCQVHGVLGEGRPLPVGDHCSVCNLYMCVGCFKKHRRLYDYWSKHIEGNLFYCTYCKSDDMFPVVGFDLVSRVFKCAKCLKSTRQTSKTNSLPDEVSQTIRKITGSANHFQCHEDLSKNERKSCTEEVYCLVCKLIMCRTCFIRHQQEN